MSRRLRCGREALRPHSRRPRPRGRGARPRRDHRRWRVPPGPARSAALGCDRIGSQGPVAALGALHRRAGAAALRASGENLSAAARTLGCARSTLRDRLDRLSPIEPGRERPLPLRPRGLPVGAEQCVMCDLDEVQGPVVFRASAPAAVDAPTFRPPADARCSRCGRILPVRAMRRPHARRALPAGGRRAGRDLGGAHICGAHRGDQGEGGAVKHLLTSLPAGEVPALRPRAPSTATSRAWRPSRAPRSLALRDRPPRRAGGLLDAPG